MLRNDEGKLSVDVQCQEGQAVYNAVDGALDG